MGERMKKLLIAIVILVVLGFAGYQFVISFASDKMIDQVAEHVLSGDEAEQLLNDPGVKKWVEQDMYETSTDDLPFHTKEEALKAVVKKFSIGELNELKNKITNGIDAQEQEEIKSILEEKLSPEEMEALKIIALKELKNRQ
jgi:flagellar basal body-associated protein FliL